MIKAIKISSGVVYGNPGIIYRYPGLVYKRDRRRPADRNGTTY